MVDESNFLTEYLAEINLMLAQMDFGNKLYDLISPIRNFLMKEKDLLSFSLSRYCGANSRIAFFCEWYYQTLRLTNNTQRLFDENVEYFSKKIPIKFRGVPNIYTLVEMDGKVFVPQQLSLLQTKSKMILDSLVDKYPYLGKYLNDQFLSQVLASTYTTNKRKYCEKLSLSEYLEAQSTGNSFVQVGFPCLVGFCYQFNQDKSLKPENIKWVLLEEILKNISLLHQINQNQNFDEFIHALELTEKEEFEWLQLSPKTKYQRILASPITREKIKSQKQKIFDSTTNSLLALNLPKAIKEMLGELLVWAQSQGYSEDKD
jgi:hypothetical protein